MGLVADGHAEHPIISIGLSQAFLTKNPIGTIIHSNQGLAQTERMDNKAIRLRNVDFLIGLAGSVGEFALLIRRDPNQVSQWRSGKPIGDRLARDIEAELGKEAGWLDLPQWQADKESMAPPPDQSQPPRLDPEIVAATHRLLRETYAEDEDGPKLYSVEEDPDLFITVYETLARLGASARPADYAALGRIIDKQRAGQDRGQQGPTQRVSGSNQASGKKRATG